MTLHFLQAVFLMLAALFLASLPRMLVRRIKARRDFDYAMQAVAAEAVACARKEYKILLDFSPASVQQVENNVLAKLHEIHVNTPMSKSELSRNSTCWGAYIGEVLKRIKGGKWQRDSQRVGQGTMPIVFAPGNEAFPSAWVYKRITNGPNDNVTFKFQVVISPETSSTSARFAFRKRLKRQILSFCTGTRRPRL